MQPADDDDVDDWPIASGDARKLIELRVEPVRACTAADDVSAGGTQSPINASVAARSERKLRRCEVKALRSRKTRSSQLPTRDHVARNRSTAASWRPWTICVSVWKLFWR